MTTITVVPQHLKFCWSCVHERAQGFSLLCRDRRPESRLRRLIACKRSVGAPVFVSWYVSFASPLESFPCEHQDIWFPSVMSLSVVAVTIHDSRHLWCCFLQKFWLGNCLLVIGKDWIQSHASVWAVFNVIRMENFGRGGSITTEKEFLKSCNLKSCCTRPMNLGKWKWTRCVNLVFVGWVQIPIELITMKYGRCHPS